LFGSLPVVHLGDYQWSSRRKKVCAALKNFVLAALHVNFNELRYRSSISDEIV
jgi:hypothetical protein